MNSRCRLVVGPVCVVASWLFVGLIAMADDPIAADRNETYRRHAVDPAIPVASRVKGTPASILNLFKENERPLPVDHPLSEDERQKLESAIATMPPLHRQVLKDRIRVISFLDGMPNTALTSTVNINETYRLFDITINASILGQTVSEWITQKERSCFDMAGSSTSVSVEAGDLDALVYVLLHEATHVVDAAMKLTPASSNDSRTEVNRMTPMTAFTRGIWDELSVPAPRFRDPIRERLRFYSGGGLVPIDEAQPIYASLQLTPFVSLYGSRNWLDDLAEYVTVFHLTQMRKQPYRIVIRKDGKDVFDYEPMKSELVRGRIGQMRRYYGEGR